MTIKTLTINLNTKGNADIQDITNQVSQAVVFDEIIDPARHYAHNARWGDGNGHSHVRAAILGASFSVPFVNRRLTLGTWQQIIFIDFDNRQRRRELVVQMMGE
jgi:secondary thiamine-phosphate synthase enzyme